MSSPGPVEHVPLKVVPMYVDGEHPESDGPPEGEPPEIQGVVTAVRTPLVGIISIAVAVIAAIVHGVAIGVGSSGDLPMATVLAYIAIALSMLAVIGGLVGLVAGFGRRTGAIAVAVGILANPVVLLAVLRWVEAFAS